MCFAGSAMMTSGEMGAQGQIVYVRVNKLRLKINSKNNATVGVCDVGILRTDDGAQNGSRIEGSHSSQRSYKSFNISTTGFNRVFRDFFHDLPILRRLNRQAILH
jgi:hypothetical protein